MLFYEVEEVKFGSSTVFLFSLLRFVALLVFGRVVSLTRTVVHFEIYALHFWFLEWKSIQLKSASKQKRNRKAVERSWEG